MRYQIQFIRQIHVVLLAFCLLAGMYPGLATVTFAQEVGGTKTRTQPDRWDRQPQLTNAAVRTEERVYKSTPQGDLQLHIWSVDVEKDLGGRVPPWGSTESVLIDGNQLICTLGSETKEPLRLWIRRRVDCYGRAEKAPHVPNTDRPS